MDPKTRLATGYATTLLTNEIHPLLCEKPYGVREKSTGYLSSHEYRTPLIEDYSS